MLKIVLVHICLHHILNNRNTILLILCIFFTSTSLLKREQHLNTVVKLVLKYSLHKKACLKIITFHDWKEHRAQNL